MAHKVHCLKTHPAPFAAIRARTKKFEFRKDDRDYQVGDTLWLEEFDPAVEQASGENEVRIVTYLLREGFGIPPGYVVMSIDDPTPTPEGELYPDIVEVAPRLPKDREADTPEGEREAIAGIAARLRRQVLATRGYLVDNRIDPHFADILLSHYSDVARELEALSKADQILARRVG